MRRKRTRHAVVCGLWRSCYLTNRYNAGPNCRSQLLVRKVLPNQKVSTTLKTRREIKIATFLSSTGGPLRILTLEQRNYKSDPWRTMRSNKYIPCTVDDNLNNSRAL